MKEFVLKGRLTLERVTFYVSAKTLEGALARAADGDFDGYETDLAQSVDWHIVLASIEDNVCCANSMYSMSEGFEALWYRDIAGEQGDRANLRKINNF